jgi:hypothetical protein
MKPRTLESHENPNFSVLTKFGRLGINWGSLEPLGTHLLKLGRPGIDRGSWEPTVSSLINQA